LFIDKSKNEIIFSGAHLHLLIIKKDGSIKTLKGERYPIGGWQLENQRTFHSKLMDIEAGDIYCIFTDGIIHQFGGINDKKFGYHRLRKILKEHSSKNATEIINEFEYYFLEWQSGYDITDDQTLMVLKF
jgi:serine phosphatase RsbU (regulator of sigma subunit)